MRNLYFKIFMWFWLAMALVGTAFVVSTVTLQNSEANSRWRSFVSSGITLSAQAAIEAYDAGGSDRLVQFFDRMERRSGLRAYLYDGGLTELSGREPLADVQALIAEAASGDELAVRELEDRRRVALSVAGPEGNAYVMLAEMDWPFRRGRRSFADGSSAARGGDRSGFRDGGRGGRGGSPSLADVWLSSIDQPAALGARLLIVFLTAGILCYGLARYLTAPVLRLRDATHRLSGGDLSVRVGPAVGNRRDELADLGRDFDTMAERIETLLTTQRQLLSDISHELRSPLARLNVALALARQRSGAQAIGALDRIESEAEQLNALIGRVLALARFESGAVEPEMAPVDLARLVEDVAADADFEANVRNASVVVTSSPPCSVRGNESLLRSAIENVVRNAIAYTAEGSDVEISLVLHAGPRVPSAPGADGDEATAVVAVRDRGPGVPDDQLGSLFKPFYRIAHARDRHSGGTGLGLSITDRAVRLHGGTVSAANAPDGGLIVEMRLPVD